MTVIDERLGHELAARAELGTAIIQMPARTPAMAAMTAMSLDQLSGGRFILGIGPSGPQVVEGWHGVPWGKPLGRTREYVLEQELETVFQYPGVGLEFVDAWVSGTLAYDVFARLDGERWVPIEAHGLPIGATSRQCR